MEKTVKWILLSLTVASMILTACDSDTIEDNSTTHQSSKKQGITTDESNKGESHDGGSDVMEDVRIKLAFNNEEVIVHMYDNPTSNDFLSLLPLTLTFEDYAGTEKISYPPNKLSTAEAPSGSDPSIGDLTYYAPWGNLAIFYKDFGHSNGLIKLGKIESGIEKLSNFHGDFTVTIEKVPN